MNGNKHSYICRFIAEHPDDWKKVLSEKSIRIKQDENYPAVHIFNYEMFGADFTDPVVQEARGIIIDTENLKVLCWPFRKFGNYEESYVDRIDWKNAKVQEKIDGSIVKLWWNPLKESWQWSTNSMIDAAKAETRIVGLSYLDIIKKAVNYKDVPIEKLSRDTTYIFELVSSMTQVVISYPEIRLWHTGTRSNITGTESVEDIGIPHPKEYAMSSLQECVHAAEMLNRDEKVEHEGYVVVDRQFHRIKIKSPVYVAMHHSATGQISKRQALTMLKDHLIEEILPDHPANRRELLFYAYQMEEVMNSMAVFMDYSRALYDELGHDRKALAAKIARMPFGWCGFGAVDGAEAADMMRRMPTARLMDLIPDYIPPKPPI